MGLGVCFPDMSQEAIIVRGARVNNLKNVSFSIPIEKLTVVTGVSGSGKSSLAFDTIYAEGQRRYVESLSAYAANRFTTVLTTTLRASQRSSNWPRTSAASVPTTL